MSTRLRILNLALGLVGCVLAAGLVREALTAHPLPPPPALRAARPVASATTAPTSTAPGPAAAYGVIATKNLFSASRSEVPAGPVVAAGPRPLLHGVVMDGPKSRAYLEDPTLKRTFSYGIGDTVGGGRVESIAVDRVVIGRGEGLVEVLLHDPSKPRPAPVAAAPTPVSPAAALGAPSTSGPWGPASATPAPPIAVPTAVAPPPAQSERR